MADPKKRADRLSTVAQEDLKPNSLVGSFFLGYPGWTRQGCVVAEVAPQVYLCEFFTWLVGDSSEQELVTLEQLMKCSFYDTAEWMRNAYEHGVSTRWEVARREEAKAKGEDPDKTATF